MRRIAILFLLVLVPTLSDFNVNPLIQLLRDYYRKTTGKEYPEEIASPEVILNHITRYHEDIIANMPGNVYWLDKNGIGLGCNRNVLKMFKLKTIDEFKKLSFEDMGRVGGWSQEATQKFKKDTSEAIYFGKEILNLEEPPIPDSDGRLIYFLTSRVPLFDHNGKSVGIVGISIDITERKMMEEELRLEKIKAEQASQAKSEFIANMSHDLRTPLSGMQALAEDIIAKAQNEEVSKNALLLLQASHDLLNLIDGILQASRLTSGQEELSCKSFMLAPLIHNTFNIMKPKAIEKSIKLNLSYDKQLPEQVIGDHLILQRILVNLLSNALKFTAKNGFVDMMIKLNRKEGSRYYIDFIVVDTGIGIPANKLDIIFEKFSRIAPSFQSQYTGSGMGLYIVKHYVEQMGGEIDVISEENQGSRFHCTIPFVIPSADHTTVSVSSSDVAPLWGAPTMKTRVLLVEDNKIVQHSQMNKLRDCGCEVTTAENAADALSYFDCSQFDLLIVDLGLPDIDGLTLIKKFRNRSVNPNCLIPIILLTAHAIPSDLAQDELAGVTEVLIKPLMMDKLKQLLRDYVAV